MSPWARERKGKRRKGMRWRGRMGSKIMLMVEKFLQ
jgi:hypothetical protein